MFRQKQNCRSDSILISVDKKVYIVYRKAFGNTESLFYVYGFSQLRALKFFVFRKMEMPETQNPPAMRVESICL